MNEKQIQDSASEDQALSSPKTGGDIYVQDAEKSFGVTKALNGVNFKANFGEIHAIVGGNGCGKSTLAKVISGVLPLDKGKVSIMGHSPNSPIEAQKVGISTVFQEVMIAEEATVYENLFIGYDSFFGKKLNHREKVEKAASIMLELAGEFVDPYTIASQLSLGMKAWITIGRAFLRNPKVLILDESSAALDFDSTERLFTKMRSLRDQGAAIFIVTHRIAELVRISDRATVMRDGKDVGVLAGDEITEKNLLRLMTGDKKFSTASENRSTPPLSKTDETVLSSKNLKVWEDGAEINFELPKGEILGVTGLDGQGQDNFVKALSGIDQPLSGEVVVKQSDEERELTKKEFKKVESLLEAKKSGIGYVSGDRKKEGIFPNMSIYENMVIPLYKGKQAKTSGGFLGFIKWIELNGIFDWEVERLSIKTGPKNNLITSLSGGNQQKVMIARAFTTTPKILILNDPARGIDVGAKRDLYKHLRIFVNEGGTVIFLSSELEEFIGLCHRVLVFRDGSIFETFEKDEIDPNIILEGMFGHTKKTSLSSQNATTKNSKGNDDKAIAAKVTQAPSKPTNIKIVDFKKKSDQTDKIKIKYF
ncbi:sugar ABC transporter ATP-binding protein [Alphaproteobacteria bacterium]|jgi:ribose transport system ATP-binding protein|nr:sugar ABC transporter ATP-binding protein [Alphaproteobacteria bacterium]MDB2636213.1 sugar ABC transporter ATP-binding protein [Alphaproteobacteria bacterium]MDB3973772.1 sugar ABC transporter ATP-binding protein [Alphaproteobacteria bacterium]MDC0594744.1 sugar ABC transporter ATP-binding protein [Alphaproteobacteria bacterium]